MFTLGCIEIIVCYGRFIGSLPFLNSRFCQGVNRQFFTFRHPGHFKHQGCGTMPDHKFMPVCKFLDYGQQVAVERFIGLGAEHRYSVSAGKYQCIILNFRSETIVIFSKFITFVMLR